MNKIIFVLVLMLLVGMSLSGCKKTGQGYYRGSATPTASEEDNGPCEDSVSIICCDLDGDNFVDNDEFGTFIGDCGGDSSNEEHVKIAKGLNNLCSCDDFEEELEDLD